MRSFKNKFVSVFTEWRIFGYLLEKEREMSFSGHVDHVGSGFMLSQSEGQTWIDRLILEPMVHFPTRGKKMDWLLTTLHGQIS